MNSINITGRLAKDPELRYTGNDIPVCTFTLAVRRPHAKDITDWISCVAWRHNAEYIGKYGTKGSMAAVAGILTVRDYTDKDGNKRRIYEVVCDSVELLQKRSSDEKGSYTANDENYSQEGTGGFEEIDDEEDLPF